VHGGSGVLSGAKNANIDDILFSKQSLKSDIAQVFSCRLGTPMEDFKEDTYGT